ncbi:MAG TPA: tail fiber protein [Bryobacteraceae bacterium]|nr:tail fiber protein [Bryobacteraceae bacterium]
MSDQFLAEIRMFGCNFAPTQWALCNGQIMAISQNTALFALLGTNFGGDGRTTFGLPNLQGRAAMDQGNGPGLTPRTVGEDGGSESVTLLLPQMPQHNHSFSVDPQAKKETSSVSNTSPSAAAAGNNFYSTATANGQMNQQMLKLTGQSLPHENRQAFQVINFCIALVGVFPARN